MILNLQNNETTGFRGPVCLTLYRVIDF